MPFFLFVTDFDDIFALFVLFCFNMYDFAISLINSKYFICRDSYSLQIQAADLGNPQRSSSAAYTVAINDENDNSPIFTTTTYRAYVKENSVAGTDITTVKELSSFILLLMYSYVHLK